LSELKISSKSIKHERKGEKRTFGWLLSYRVIINGRGLTGFVDFLPNLLMAVVVISNS
jgi:hypothetical protein